jgi:hypothetical protein
MVAKMAMVRNGLIPRQLGVHTDDSQRKRLCSRLQIFRVLTHSISLLSLQPLFYTAMPRRNSILLRVFLSFPSNSSIASTGGTPVSARRRMTTLLYSSG